MTSAEKYVTAAYLVVLAFVLLYILYAFKLARLERVVAEIPLSRSEQGEGEKDRSRAAS